MYFNITSRSSPKKVKNINKILLPKMTDILLNFGRKLPIGTHKFELMSYRATMYHNLAPPCKRLYRFLFSGIIIKFWRKCSFYLKVLCRDLTKDSNSKKFISRKSQKRCKSTAGCSEKNHMTELVVRCPIC